MIYNKFTTSSTIIYNCPKHRIPFQWTKDHLGHDVLVCFACVTALNQPPTGAKP